MATASKLLTYEDWLQMPTVEDGRDEVVRGEYRFMPAPHFPHPDIIEGFARRFYAQTDAKKVSVISSLFGLLISKEPLTFRSPDLALYWKERETIEDGNRVTAPDLIIEVLSPSENRRRKEEKMDDYASIGVPEVWLVSPEAHSVEVRMLRAGVLKMTALVIEGALEPSRFPGVSISVAEIWPEEK